MKTPNLAEALIELARQKEDIVVISQDTAEGIKQFAQKHPGKFIHCGKAAQSTTGIAAGMALEGKTAFAFGCITSGKNWDQIRIIAHDKLNVKIIDADDTFEDIALARALSTMTVILPADREEALKAIIAAGTMHGPVYIKLPKNTTSICKEAPFTIGRAEIVRAGKDCTILACGAAVAEAARAAEKLSKQEIECTILNCHTLQPIDKHAILGSAHITNCMVSAAENPVLASVAAELLSQHAPVPLRIAQANQDSIIRAVKEAVLLRCESVCTAVPEQHGRTLSYEIQPELYFRLHGGGVIKSIPGLKKALLDMSDETFSYHCNAHKNDFSTWVHYAFKEPALAQQINKNKTRLGMALALARWLA